MELEITGAYIHFVIPILGGIPVTQTMISQLVLTILLCTVFICLGKKITKRPGGMQVLIEQGVGIMQSMVAETMGAHNVHWTPFICTIFLCSICGSYIGLTGFLRSTTADLSCTLTWALMVTFIIWYNNIKHNGFLGWLKGFTEPVAVMTPMNLVSEVAQPVSMAFRHFGNVAGGGVINLLLYTALSLASTALLNFIAGSGWLICAVLIVAGGLLLLFGRKRQKKLAVFFGIVSAILGLFGLLQALGILSGVPILTYGIPAVLSCYFDIFSGFVQAFVFTLLTMVYISGSLPGPEDAE